MRSDEPLKEHIKHIEVLLYIHKLGFSAAGLDFMYDCVLLQLQWKPSVFTSVTNTIQLASQEFFFILIHFLPLSSFHAASPQCIIPNRKKEVMKIPKKGTHTSSSHFTLLLSCFFSSCQRSHHLFLSLFPGRARWHWASRATRATRAGRTERSKRWHGKLHWSSGWGKRKSRSEPTTLERSNPCSFQLNTFLHSPRSLWLLSGWAVLSH